MAMTSRGILFAEDAPYMEYLKAMKFGKYWH